MANIRKSFNLRSGVQVDEDNLLVNSVGNVGLGTTVPTETLDVRGNIKSVGVVTAIGGYISGGFESVGVSTFSGNVHIGAAITAYPATGIISATSFRGEGSQLTGVSGFGSAFDNTSGTLGNLIYETPRNFHATGVTSAYIVAESSSGNMAFTRLSEIRLGTGATMHIGAGTTLIMNVLNLF